MALNGNLKVFKLSGTIKSIKRHIASAASQTHVDSHSNNNSVPWEKVVPKPQTHYGGRHTVTLLPGTGIGPELMGYVKQVFNHIGAPVDFEEIDMDLLARSEDGLEHAITSIVRNGIALKSNINRCSIASRTPADADEVTTNNAMLRKKLGLFVNSVHCKSLPGLPQRHNDVDVLVIRQNTEGEYAMHEHETVKGVVESMKVVSRVNAERVIRFAFDSAMLHKRKKVTTVHKANIMKISDGFFLNVSREVAKDYPKIIHDDMIVDAACMRLISTPKHFDVILTTNLYGSIISNILCGMVGGAGLVAGKNVAERCVTYEPASRSSGFEIAGQNVANPIAMLSASANLLAHLGHHGHAELIYKGIEGCIEGKVWTRDLGGSASSKEVVESILMSIERAAADGSVCRV